MPPLPPADEHPGHLCGQHYVHCGVRHARFVRTATLLRIGVVVAAGLAGPVGLAGAFFVLLLSLSGTGMLGVPYLAQHPFPQSPLAEDGVIRRNYRHLSCKGFNIWQNGGPAHE